MKAYKFEGKHTQHSRQFLIAAAALVIATLLFSSPSFQAQTITLTECKKEAGNSRKVGDRLIFIVPKGAKVKTGSDVDYSEYSITVSAGKKKYFLSGIFGPTATSGVVPKDLLEEGVVDEKHWRFRDPNSTRDVTGVDARGRNKNGNYWRYFGTLEEAAHYTDVPKEAADVFDKIFDSVCYKPW